MLTILSPRSETTHTTKLDPIITIQTLRNASLLDISESHDLIHACTVQINCRRQVGRGNWREAGGLNNVQKINHIIIEIVEKLEDFQVSMRVKVVELALSSSHEGGDNTEVRSSVHATPKDSVTEWERVI
jgi:hypothetical protein